ncbi:MAG: helix-turn-helix domain-containing protein [Neomegalonema sp.]|nr:helix-turn-helix domain-containing protein [Neomegalonema sp.]
MTRSTDPESMGHRIKLLRAHLGMTQVAFAESIGVNVNNIRQVEVGNSRLGLDTLVRIKRTHSVTLDWLIEGDVSGLRYEMAAALTPAETNSAPLSPPAGPQ